MLSAIRRGRFLCEYKIFTFNEIYKDEKIVMFFMGNIQIAPLQFLIIGCYFFILCVNLESNLMTFVFCTDTNKSNA